MSRIKLPLVATIVALATATAVVAFAWALGAIGGGSGKPSPAAFPEGVFRYTLTRAEVLALDAALGADEVANSVGTFTWTLKSGTISLEQTGCDCTVTGVVGTYVADPASRRLRVVWSPTTRDGDPFCLAGDGSCEETVGWSYDGKALRITPLDGADRDDLVFWGGRKPWVRVA
ncbi:MAG: hypothetical protein U0R50_03955 [Gaiellales bacterium]